MKKQGEFLCIGDRFATYGMDNSHEISANSFKKNHILGDFRVNSKITRSNQVKELLWNWDCIFNTIGMIPTVAKTGINSVDFNFF